MAEKRPTGIDEQAVIDMVVAEAVAGRPTSEGPLSSLLTLMESIPEGDDPFNSDWAGFQGGETLGIGVYLSDAVQEALERSSGAHDGVDSFRSVLGEIAERGTAYFCRGIRASSGVCAWIGFSQNDAAEASVEGVFPTTLAFEEHLRAEGVIFPYEDEPPPSGRNDVFTDDQILALLADPKFRASEPTLFLDFYDVGARETKWCWKNETTRESSQEFDSKEEALEAWRNDKLEWSRLDDLGN